MAAAASISGGNLLQSCTMALHAAAVVLLSAVAATAAAVRATALALQHHELQPLMQQDRLQLWLVLLKWWL